ncbi:MAG: two pore domain potassium channel family protein [Nocardioidaceae bacterium]|nr:two pore domain potassium channel family protein [Nocardioidaceae bacterium]NUS50741.1 two pore domain potassium channel family protein [Nocardioidaceae bacterium]
MVRATLVTVVGFGLYFTLPFDEKTAFNSAAALFVGLILVAGMLVWQARIISTSPYPRVRALEGLVTTFPIVILLFATTYFVYGEREPANFSESMTRVDSLYFTVTVFATVGFGDITAVSQSARGLVTLQMVVDLVLIGLVVRAFVGSVQRSLERQENELEHDQPVE